MPTYDYTCAECAHKLEAFQKITDEPLSLCPHCKKSALVRGIGGAGASFRFQGTGFYETDYKRGPAKKEEAAKACCPCGKNQCK